MKKYLFIEYPKCTTCQKAKAFLDAAGVEYQDRHIVEANPTAEEHAKWVAEAAWSCANFSIRAV